MINYKVREERDGAIFFNRLSGRADKLTEDQYLSLANSKLLQRNKEWQFIRAKDRKNLPDDCLAAPSRIYFELTRKCNLGCKACFNESSVALKKELSTMEVFKILDQLAVAGTFEIRFTGGEPTSRKDFFKIIDYAKKLGFYISMGTNGVYSGEARKKIIESGVDWFIVSLEGPEKVNDRIRGKGNYAKALKTLKELSKKKKRIRINTVVGKYNKSEVGFLANLADSVGAESLNLIPLRPYGRAAKLLPAEMLSPKEFYAMIRDISELRKKHKVKFTTTIDLLNKDNLSQQDLIVKKEKTCAAGVEAAVISPLGEIYGCSYSPASDIESKDTRGRKLFVAGDLRKAPLTEVWLDGERWAPFRRLDKYKNEKCHSCRHYKHECVGSCVIMSYHKSRTLDDFDPYCFKDFLGGDSCK